MANYPQESQILDSGSMGGASGGGASSMVFPSDLFTKYKRPQWIGFWANMVEETKFGGAGTSEGAGANKTDLSAATSILLTTHKYTRQGGSVAISMPNGFSHSYSVNWSSDSTGNAGAMGKAMSDGINAALSSKDGTALSSAVEALQANQSSTGTLDTLGKNYFMYELYKQINKSDTGRTIQAMGKMTINPHVEVLFDGVAGNRTFSYEFKFYPTKPEESVTIKDIVYFFRFHSAPEIESADAYGRFYRYPSVFDIAVMNGDDPNPFIPKVFTCACTSVDVTHNGSNWVTFEDGAPSEVSMRVSFVELEQITKEKIVKGF